MRASPIPLLLGALEGSVIRVLRLRNRFAPLFIVGAPRSGTTVVYQHLVNTFEFGYLPNLAKKRPLACVSYTALARLRYHFRPSYRSSFGETDGPLSPSDGWDVFHRWFPRYDYTVPVKENRLHELRTIIRLVEQIFRAPFINKNNSNSVRITHLSRLIPDALFLHVRRELAPTVASLLRARAHHGVPAGEWWGTPPPQFFDRSFGDELQQVVAQVWGLDCYIEEELAKLDGSKWVRVTYEEFCREPHRAERLVEALYGRTGYRIRRRPTPPAPGIAMRGPYDAELEELRRSVEAAVLALREDV